MRARTTVVFDLGGVLIDWNPRYLYRQLIDDEGELERFLAEVCNQAWNEQQDAGRSCAEAVADLSARHPAYAPLIAVYYERFGDMLGGAIDGTVEVLAELRDREVPLYALSNWSAETFPHAQERFGFLGWFRGLLISGQEGVRKPAPAIFELLFERFAIDPTDALFIDDVESNVVAARATGMEAIRFESPAQLRAALREHGL